MRDPRYFTHLRICPNLCQNILNRKDFLGQIHRFTNDHQPNNHYFNKFLRCPLCHSSSSYFWQEMNKDQWIKIDIIIHAFSWKTCPLPFFTNINLIYIYKIPLNKWAEKNWEGEAKTLEIWQRLLYSPFEKLSLYFILLTPFWWEKKR